MLQHIFFLDVAIVDLRCCNMFFLCCNYRYKMLKQHIFLMLQQSRDVAICFFECCNSRLKMLQHLFLDVATIDLGCCNMFFWMLHDVSVCCKPLFLNVASND
jgi:hypothetical protein